MSIRKRIIAIITALFMLGAPIAACADPIHFDLTGSSVSERNDKNLARISTFGGTLSTDVKNATAFVSVGQSTVRRANSAVLAQRHYSSPVYSFGLTLPISTFATTTVSYGRAIDDGVVSAAQPRTIRSLTVSGTVHVF